MNTIGKMKLRQTIVSPITYYNEYYILNILCISHIFPYYVNSVYFLIFHECIKIRSLFIKRQLIMFKHFVNVSIKVVQKSEQCPACVERVRHKRAITRKRDYIGRTNHPEAVIHKINKVQIFLSMTCLLFSFFSDNISFPDFCRKILTWLSSSGRSLRKRTATCWDIEYDTELRTKRSRKSTFQETVSILTRSLILVSSNPLYTVFLS